MIKGFADLKGTSEYFSRHCEIPARKTPWFMVSPIAMGTHLGDMTEGDSILYRQSLSYALTHGINFVDTAINYRGMKSERDIGKVLSKLISGTRLKRKEIIISTKAGLIPGDIDAKLVPVEYLKEILLFNNIISESDLNIVEHRKHVLTPSYYQFAMEESRKHLNLDTIDIYYIHNPEISMRVLGPQAFYEKLVELFSYLEQAVLRGKIRFYGMATWDAFLVSSDHPSYISLEKVIETAERAAGRHHHFKFVQFPFNENRSEAIRNKNQVVSGVPLTILKASNELGIYVTTSAPFDLGNLIKARDATALLKDVTETEGILSVMTGMKHEENVKVNLGSITMHRKGDKQ
jgi:predicted aldo/keto reductase-like oxidoreductase